MHDMEIETEGKRKHEETVNLDPDTDEQAKKVRLLDQLIATPGVNEEVIQLDREPENWCPASMVLAGDRKELQGLLDNKVFEPAKMSEAPAKPRMIGTRFTRKMKGAEVKSRLVIQDVRGHSGHTESEFFAPTPSRPTLRLQLIVGSMWQNQDTIPHKGAILDVTQAFPHAALEAEDVVMIWLPKEAHNMQFEVVTDKKRKKIVTLNANVPQRLLRALYGYRRSPKLWQQWFASVVIKLGMKQSLIDPTLFYDLRKRLILVVYVDDMLLLGRSLEVDLFIGQLQKQVNLKVMAMLERPNDRGVMLGRQITKTALGYTVKVGGKLVREMLKEFGITDKDKPAATPETKLTRRQEDEAILLPREHVSTYRRFVGQLLHQSHDRPEIQFSCKERARRMQQPRDVDHTALKRTMRFLLAHPDLEARYEVQQPLDVLKTYVDADWCGEVNTRRSTSGDLMTLQGCYVLSWCRTQSTITLSTAESEYLALVTGAQEAACVKNICRELQIDIEIELLSDASGALASAERAGVGHMRHMEMRVLFLKQLVKDKVLRLRKVRSFDNPADFLTKAVSAECQQRCMRLAGCWIADDNDVK